uniref:Uncharacterized protein n=1 Tax=Anguilla anguilla TaxID=7936 RepID=A0A0E9UYK0_ANGAN
MLKTQAIGYSGLITLSLARCRIFIIFHKSICRHFCKCVDFELYCLMKKGDLLNQGYKLSLRMLSYILHQ